MKVSPSTISVFMHTERQRGVAEGQYLACDAALLKSASNITAYLEICNIQLLPSQSL